MSIKLKLDGFEDLLKQIEEAGGTIDKATESCLKKSADIMHDELITQMQKSNVDSDLISSMPPPEIEVTGNRYIARVGYKKGAYDPNNPSGGYKIVFLNYGTPNRSKHGKVIARGFIQRAKKKANAPIKRAQKETIEKILESLKV